MATLTDRAAALAKHLLSEKRAGRSWRRIAREDYNDEIHFSVLNRIALHGGEYIPKDRKQLILLGLIEKKKLLPGERRVQLKIGRMAKDTESAVIVIRRKK